MGKAENIKRAKRLKEAKRKRGQEELLASGFGPSGIEIKKRAELNGAKTILNQSKIKYSELLKSYVQPIVEDESNIDILRMKFTLGVYAWNAALIKEKSAETYVKLKKELTSLLPDETAIEVLFEEMVKRKKEEFAEYNNLIVDFEIKKLWGRQYDLTVATSPLFNVKR